MSEVLCLPTTVVDLAAILEQGGHLLSTSMPFNDLDKFEFVDRQRTEEPGTGYVQVIPYILVRRAGTPGLVLSYQRVKKSGEKRLIGKRSIGFGGHVDPEDAKKATTKGTERRKHGFWDVVGKAAARELKEELGEEAGNIAQSLLVHGLIYSDASPVNQVHLGLLCLAEIPPENEQLITVCEDDGHDDLRMINIQEVLDNPDDFEDWSVLAAKSLS